MHHKLYLCLYCYRPLMIGTQKLTSLAFSIHDGIYKTEDQLSEDQKKLAVKCVATTLKQICNIENNTILCAWSTCGVLVRYINSVKWIICTLFTEKGPIFCSSWAICSTSMEFWQDHFAFTQITYLLSMVLTSRSRSHNK